MRNNWFIISYIATVSLVLAFSGATAGESPADEAINESSQVAATLIRGTQPFVEGPAQRVFFVSYSKNEQELMAVRARLVETGARAISTILPDAIVCELPLHVDPGSLLEGTSIYARTQPLGGQTIAPVLPDDLGWLRRAYDIHDARKSDLKPELDQSTAGGSSEGGLMEVSRASIERSAFLYEQRQALAGGPDAVAAQDVRLPDQNAEFFAGNIHIQIVFLEKKDSGSWTPSEKGDVKAGIEITKMYFDQQFRNMRVKFSSRTFDAEVGWDPLDNELTDVINDVRPLLDDVMTRMGYLGEPRQYLERVNQFNEDARTQFGTADWVFTVFVVDSSHKENHSFEGRRQVHAQLGGPFMILAYPATYPGLSYFERYFKHGVAAVFWGLPEDKGYPIGSCNSRSGYLNVEHKNKVVLVDRYGGMKDCGDGPPDPCIALFSSVEGGYSGAPCDYTKGHMGNWDNDGDNVPDIFDAPPTVVFSGPPVDTLTSLGQPVRFTVRSRAVINKNSQQTHPRRNYATQIERVSYSLNGLPAILVDPVDGVADEAVEQYDLRIGFLLPGYSEIQVNVWNNYGAKSVPKFKDVFYVGLDYFSFRFEHRDNGTGVAWFLRGTTFGANLELHRIDYRDDSDVVIAGPDVLRPIRPKKDGLTPYYFLDNTASAGVEYGYYVTGSFTLPYRGEDKPFASSSRVFDTVVSIPRNDGILSVPAPNPFQPSVNEENLRLSVNIPGAEGIALFNKGGTILRAPAQQTTPEPVNLKVGVYDVAGRLVSILFDDAVFDQVVNVDWDGSNSSGAPVPSGMYFIKARAGDTFGTKKVLVIR